jgi:hypothetical protein
VLVVRIGEDQGLSSEIAALQSNGVEELVEGSLLVYVSCGQLCSPLTTGLPIVKEHNNRLRWEIVHTGRTAVVLQLMASAPT